MSEENNLEEIKKFWPKDAPDVTNVPKYVKKYKKDLDGVHIMTAGDLKVASKLSEKI